MKKQLLIVLGLLVVVGAGMAVWRLMGSDNAQNNSSKTDLQTSTRQTDSSDGSQQSTTSSTDEAEQSVVGRYITLVEYESNQIAYAGAKRVYFFHASWCPICKEIDEDLTNNTSQIPDGVTIIKTDFDKETELRKKYGVTYQYSFVQVDKDGNEIAQWTADTLDKVFAGIK